MYSTSWTRRGLGIAKTHVNDALCLRDMGTVDNVAARRSVVSEADHGDRQMLGPPGRHGNPRGQRYRECCALPRQVQGAIPCPGHRSRGKQVSGIGSGDLVRFDHQRHGVLTGYEILAKNAGRAGVSHEGPVVSVKAPAVTLLARNHGYRVGMEQT